MQTCPDMFPICFYIFQSDWLVGFGKVEGAPVAYGQIDPEYCSEHADGFKT